MLKYEYGTLPAQRRLMLDQPLEDGEHESREEDRASGKVVS